MEAPVLLTGATGDTAGRLLRHFEEAGRPVRCLTRNPQPHPVELMLPNQRVSR